MAKIIFILPTEEMSVIKDFNESLKTDTAVIPEGLKILIKNEAGYWKEVGRKKIKLGDMEIED